MDRLQERLASAEKALASFQKLTKLEDPNDVERDASIHRFKFTFEASWKTAKQYLYEIEGIDVGSPKGVMRSCREVQLLEEDEAILALEMVNDRNLTVHTYNEEVAVRMYSRLSDYDSLIEQWLQKMKEGVGRYDTSSFS
ncbi:HI0074 family nucleotidyltransferase substrate-binding subunit [Alkalicoccus chagannorensis]|uniref:HI0074 family nucleotidyltransferase substrate-binding subunit n=1 Tax=Alkalicoccus chagannorensis TaxID=427072 RepID=UPI0004266F76|nr:HI0074 family nucleotidyltransferase substrate-binding subunit [Alkalicoccus chagannorensis]